MSKKCKELGAQPTVHNTVEARVKAHHGLYGVHILTLFISSGLRPVVPSPGFVFRASLLCGGILGRKVRSKAEKENSGKVQRVLLAWQERMCVCGSVGSGRQWWESD